MEGQRVGTRRTIRVPRLTRIALRSFSLYRMQPVISVETTESVFCLAGANGLGKSSFIAALNYALTGGVNPPRTRLSQLSDYVRDAKKYGLEYFDGRIGEIDRVAAEVSLDFELNGNIYSITRGFFEPESLRSLRICNKDGIEISEQAIGGDERQSVYEDHLILDSGLQTFSQYVFLQHFVLTFDEHRQLLFWDERANELVLYLALGLDPELARQTDALRKAASAANSLARNAQYQATSARQQLRQLRSTMAGDDGKSPELLEEYRELLQQRAELSAQRTLLTTQRADTRLALANASAQQLRLRQDYERAFSQRRDLRTSKITNSLVLQSLSDHRCRVCGTQHPSGPRHIEEALAEQHCPLCQAQLLGSSEAPIRDGDTLQRLDEALAKASVKTVDAQERLARLEKEAEAIQKSLAAVQANVSKLEDDQGVSPELLESTSKHEELSKQISALESAVDVALAMKDEQLQRRAHALAAYEPIRSELISAWREAEIDFVPRFRALAEGFIGLPLHVQLDEGGTMFGNAHLALSVDSKARRTSTQLSESQRFFLDIALRMSVAQYMTPSNANCSIFVDTPEGALDIAYEARAGEMFSAYAAEGDQLIMTANVNTSQLLRRLARKCGHKDMKLVRMTEWTTLSEVQVREEDLFDEAFEGIEKALDQGGRHSDE